MIELEGAGAPGADGPHRRAARAKSRYGVGRAVSAEHVAIGIPGVESEEVVAALMGLGYSQAEASDAVARSDLPADAAIAEKVRLALAYFARARAGD